MSDISTWLLDSDPAIRWQVKSDLLHEPADDERARVAHEGWGARLLDLQGEDGHWAGASFVPEAFTSTFETLWQLRELGLDPASERAKQAIARVHAGCDWGEEWGHSPFFEGEVEPCINGRTLASGAYFGHASGKLAERLLSEQLPEGGWNCDAPKSQRSSFHTTLCVLEGLLGYEKATGVDLGVARRRGEEYLLERGLLRRKSTGEVVDAEWTDVAHPTRWHYDVLWGLDYFRRAGGRPDPRVAEALDLVSKKRGPDGRWRLERVHPGRVHFEMEEPGMPSRWNTLRSLRVLDWAG